MLTQEIRKIFKGEIVEKDIEVFGRDASIFEVKPAVVVKPQDVDDLKKLVKFVSENKLTNTGLSLTARAGD